jgi:ATP-binding cassette subfamily B protein
MIYAPLRELANLPKLITYFGVSVSKMFDLLDEKEEMKDAPDAKAVTVVGEVEFKNVSFGYDETREILKDINLTVKPGEMIGIVGRSGAGKSTLINLIMRMYDPTSGSITVDGHDLRDLKQESYRSQIGVVLQENYLFTGSVYENILYAKPDAGYDEVIAAAKAAKIHNYIMRLPEGYDTVLSDEGINISKGQRQLITIARAMLSDSPMLILDEATSNVDSRTEIKIQEAMGELMRGRTCFVIAHRLSTIQNADKILVIRDGKISEQGNHEELLALGGFYSTLYNSQFS